MQFIKAFTDYYGEPTGQSVYINTKYIIKIKYVGGIKSPYGPNFPAHYMILVDTGKFPEELHITLEDGNKLIKGEEHA